eukprot:gb/GEZN01012063.1/.p1 GENE.gb/GEZN01012063.1/~~gb/GEZN01012063.1/.p1  ORF type:complete len:272 (+),score=32.03 gb/GEZN01012063.1/:98-913(+)
MSFFSKWLQKWDFLSRIRSDVQCIIDRDPAARSTMEVLLCYPGLHVLFMHRWAHWLWENGFKFLARFISQVARFLTGIEIHPAATIGERVFFDHAIGVVVGETAVIGDGCTIYQEVTLGGTSHYKKGNRRHPTLGKGVMIGAGAKVLGGIEVGDGAIVGSNAVAIKPIPKGATAVGNPARIIGGGEDRKKEGKEPSGPKKAFSAYGVTQNDDPYSLAMQGLIKNASSQERQIALLWKAMESLSSGKNPPIPPDALHEVCFEADKLNKLIGD